MKHIIKKHLCKKIHPTAKNAIEDIVIEKRGDFMEGYNYEVVAEFSDSLSNEEETFIKSYVDNEKRKLNIRTLNETTYCKNQPIVGYDDFGAVTLFFFQLESKKEYFSKLEYHNLWEGKKRVAV